MNRRGMFMLAASCIDTAVEQLQAEGTPITVKSVRVRAKRIAKDRFGSKTWLFLVIKIIVQLLPIIIPLILEDDPNE